MQEPEPGTTIDHAVQEAYDEALQTKSPVNFDFNGSKITVGHKHSLAENLIAARRELGLPDNPKPLIPVTAADALAEWDAGKSVFTVEMGGLGPGYEQAIQILVVELLRDSIGKPLPEPTDHTWGDATVSRIDEQMGGYSGAQVGAAKTLAYRALRDGWAETINSAPKDRHIQVAKGFPQLTPSKN